MSIEKRVAQYAVSKRKQDKPQWRPVEIEDLDVGAVVAFDQTIAKTAWVYLLSRGNGVSILQHGMCRQPPVPDKAGFEDTLTRATWLSWQIEDVCKKTTPSVIIHEMPAVHGHRTDSSLLAALAIRFVADRRHVPVKMFSAQAVKKVLTGRSSAEKVEVRNALVELVGRPKGRWNEDLYDALGLAVGYLHQRRAKRV